VAAADVATSGVSGSAIGLVLGVSGVAIVLVAGTETVLTDSKRVANGSMGAGAAMLI